MFGVVPRQLWQKLNPPDDNNMCTWGLRCLLIETEGRKILVDTGMGDKQDAKFRSHFEPHGSFDLISSLAEKGFSPEDITDVFLTHLHFDHVGGALKKSDNGDIVPTFPNASYWSNQKHVDWALDPNPREKASFLKENIVPLQTAGVLQMVDVAEGEEWLPGIRIRYANGHTEAMMLLQIDYNGQTIVYCADLLASSFHISLPWVMSYDIRPLITLNEKSRLLNEAYEGNWILYFEHDPKTECIRLTKNQKGRIVVGERMLLSDI